MSVTRRDFLRLIGLIAAGTAAGCSPLAGFLPDKDEGDFSEFDPFLWSALERMTYGITPSEYAEAAGQGLTGWIERQLAPDDIPDQKTNLLLDRIEILNYSADQLRGRADGLLDNYDPDLVLEDFRKAALLRMIYSRRQLYEIMVEFWTDHLNISVQKGDCWYLKPVDDREVIRPHALGNFRELLGASARSPAMLVYLDNQANRRSAPNENYARELLELHTLGVNGGYQQQDVMELARCLTGWTVKDHFWRGDVKFDSQIHDPGSKQVLGKTIPPLGKKELDLVLDQLAFHPSTADHIAFKLVRRFISDHPPEELVKRSAAAFLKSGGDIQSTLRVILLDGISTQKPIKFQPKYKRPVNFLVSAVRQTGADTDGGPALQRYLQQMGQPLYAWPTPDGYPDTASSWQGNLLPRWKFSLDLVNNHIPGTRFSLDSLSAASGGDPQEFLQLAARRLLGTPLPAPVLNSIIKEFHPALRDDLAQAGRTALAALLSAPQFQWR